MSTVSRKQSKSSDAKSEVRSKTSPKAKKQRATKEEAQRAKDLQAIGDYFSRALGLT